MESYGPQDAGCWWPMGWWEVLNLELVGACRIFGMVGSCGLCSGGILWTSGWSELVGLRVVGNCGLQDESSVCKTQYHNLVFQQTNLI